MPLQLNYNFAVRKVDVDRRQFVRSMALGTAFVVPLIASYSMDGLRISTAYAVARGGTPDQTEESPRGVLGWLINLIRLFLHSGPPPP